MIPSPSPIKSRGLRQYAALGVVLLLTAGGAPAQVGGIAPKFLADPNSPAITKQIKPGDAQTTFTAGPEGITVNIAGGPAGYPGISVVSETGAPWDLTPWGHVSAKITNLGTERLSMGMRVDNQNDGKSNSCETLGLNPGESKVLKVIFGYSYGYKESFKLNPGSIIQILFMANGKKDTPRSFRIEDLQASGSSGEQPPFDPSTFRTAPEKGAIHTPAAKIDAAKQLLAKGGARAAVAADGNLHIDFAGGPKEESVTLQPAVGSWQLTDYIQVRVRIKNTGTSPVTPRARLESRGGTSDTIDASAPIPPNGEGEITIPFTAVVPPVIPTDPRQEVFGPGTWSEQNWSPKPGTGTKFTSDWTKGVTILSDKSGGAQSLVVTSVTASVPKPEIPSWVGQKPPVEGDWTKTFEDNFDKDTLDLKTWNIYTHNYWDKRTHFSKDNTLIKDGKLHLHYEKKTGYQNDDPNDTKTVGKTDYACGFADTFGKWRQLYGYFEARVKLPKAPGLWPAFWTMPDRGPETGKDAGSRASTRFGGMEHDILEFLSGWGPYRYNTAFHWDGYGKEHKSAGTSCNYVLPDKDGFITTGVYWIPGLAVYYAQGKEILRWESPRVCSVPSYIMFNMVSGGWDNVPLEDAKLPDDFIIDYVRVWQRKDLASPIDGPIPNKGLPSSVSEEAVK